MSTMRKPWLSGLLTMLFVFAVLSSTALCQAQEEPKVKNPPVDVLFLNLNAQGELLVAGSKDSLKTEAEIKEYLSKEYADAKNAAKANGDDEVKTIVIIRASKDADFPPVFKILQAAKAAGFKRWQFRAIAGANQDKAKPVAQEPGKAPVVFKVLVRAGRDGKNEGGIGSIVVQSSEAEISIRNVEALEKYLTVMRKDLANQEDINIVAEGKLKYAAVIEVMDACLRAGFTKVGFLPPPDMDK
jgi:biopolymer transport protein ExbD